MGVDEHTPEQEERARPQPVDLDVSVRFRPVSGKEDASGGIIFRAQDGRNYLLVRANALENNFRLYTMVNGRRSTIASARVNTPCQGPNVPTKPATNSLAEIPSSRRAASPPAPG